MKARDSKIQAEQSNLQEDVAHARRLAAVLTTVLTQVAPSLAGSSDGAYAAQQAVLSGRAVAMAGPQQLQSARKEPTSIDVNVAAAEVVCGTATGSALLAHLDFPSVPPPPILCF